MRERVEKATYYFKHKPREENNHLLVRRVSFGRDIVSYQVIGEFTSQEKGSLRLLRKRVHKGRVNEMVKDKAGQYNLEAVIAGLSWE